MESMKNRAERFSEEAETLAFKGLQGMGRILFKKDVPELEKRGFRVERKERKTSASWYCIITWSLQRQLTFEESQYISWGCDGEENFPKTANFAERCALITMRAQAKACGDNSNYPDNEY